MRLMVQRGLKNLIKPVVTILLALVLGALLILPTGTDPLEAYSALFKGAFGSTTGILNTLERSTPLLFTGLGAAIAFRAGVFNIGLEGQLYMGAFAAALTGIYGADLPRILIIPLCMAAAMLGSVLWAVIPGALHTKYSINLVVVTIMMNNIAKLFTNYLCTYPFKGDLPTSATHKLGENALMTRFSERSEFNTFFFVGIAAAIVLYVIVYKTRFGYELRALGLNRRFTEYNGVNVKKKILAILFLSAMLAGLCGAEQVMGANQRFIDSFSANYGMNGITVALLGGMNPLGAIVGAIFLGALNSGAVQMEVMTNVSRDLISALQAVIIMLLATQKVIRSNRWKKIWKRIVPGNRNAGEVAK